MTMDDICLFKFWNQVLENSFQFVAVYKLQGPDSKAPI